MIDGREEYTNFTVEDLEFLKEVTYTFGVTPLVIGGDYDYYLLDELEEL